LRLEYPRRRTAAADAGGPAGVELPLPEPRAFSKYSIQNFAEEP